MHLFITRAGYIPYSPALKRVISGSSFHGSSLAESGMVDVEICGTGAFVIQFRRITNREEKGFLSSCYLFTI